MPPTNPASEDPRDQPPGFGRGPAWEIGDDHRSYRQSIFDFEKRQTVTDANLRSIKETLHEIELAIKGNQTAENPGMAGRTDRLEVQMRSLRRKFSGEAKRHRMTAKSVDRLTEKMKGWTWAIRLAAGAFITAAVAAIWAMFGGKKP